jgi:hypothetical protein
MGPALVGQAARVWADEVTIHVLIDGQLVKTVPSSLNPEDLTEQRMRGAALAGPPPAMPAPARAALLLWALRANNFDAATVAMYRAVRATADMKKPKSRRCGLLQTAAAPRGI